MSTGVGDAKCTPLDFVCVTCVHSPLFDDRVWQFPLPAFETQKLLCLRASDWSTPPSLSHCIFVWPSEREWVHSQMLFHSTKCGCVRKCTESFLY